MRNWDLVYWEIDCLDTLIESSKILLFGYPHNEW